MKTFEIIPQVHTLCVDNRGSSLAQDDPSQWPSKDENTSLSSPQPEFCNMTRSPFYEDLLHARHCMEASMYFLLRFKTSFVVKVCPMQRWQNRHSELLRNLSAVSQTHVLDGRRIGNFAFCTVSQHIFEGQKIMLTQHIPFILPGIPLLCSKYRLHWLRSQYYAQKYLPLQIRS